MNVKKDVSCGCRLQKSQAGLGCMSLLLVKKGGVGGNVCAATGLSHTGTKALFLFVAKWNLTKQKFLVLKKGCSLPTNGGKKLVCSMMQIKNPF